MAKVSKKLLFTDVHATGNSFTPPGVRPALMLTTGACVLAFRQLRAVTVTSYVPGPEC
jgi:hypothetical protein